MKREELTQRQIENIIRRKCIAWKCSYRQIEEWVYEVSIRIELGSTSVDKRGRFNTEGSRDVVEFNLDSTINKVVTEFQKELLELLSNLK